MSLANASLTDIIKKQYCFKLQSYAPMFVSLAAVQLIALFFTLGGMVGSMSSGSNFIDVTVKYYSGAGISAFTFFWALITAFIITLPHYRYIDFSFVGNRLSSNLANIAFLLTGSVAGGVTAILGSILLRNIAYYSGSETYILGFNYFITPRELLTGIIVSVLYLVLLSALGYFCGMLVQVNKILLVALPAFIIGVLILETKNEHIRIITRAFSFFADESAPALFILKIVAGALLLWACAVLLSNKTAVRV